jgi:DUF1680 family protein
LPKFSQGWALFLCCSPSNPKIPHSNGEDIFGKIQLHLTVDQYGKKKPLLNSPGVI